MRGSKVAILDHMRDYGSITSMEAFSVFGVTRLSARILELREMGYDIETMMLETTTRFGETARYGKYILKGEPKHEQRKD